MPSTPSFFVAAADMLDKVSTPTSRAGSTIERVGRLLKSGIHPEDLANMLNRSVKGNRRFTPEMVAGFGLLHEVAKTKAPITAKQTRALLKDQQSETGCAPHLAGAR
ncbi:hypothetical protein OSJ57_11135 [Sphingomonas sp. HH69]